MAKHKTKTWNGQAARYVQVKMDGNYTRIETGAVGYARALTSNDINITRKVQQYRWFRPHYASVPFNTVVLGELYVPGKPCSDVKTALNEGWPNLKFSAFAVASMAADAPLEAVARFCKSHGIDFLDWRRIMEGDTVERLFEQLPQYAEGYVLKDANLLNWYRLKPVKTVDVIVTGLTPGAGKYTGMVGSLVCGTAEGYEVATCSGMTDDVRAGLSIADIGRVIEVAYQSVGSRGRLRHPRFIRWRDDKLPEECFIDQDPELEARWT